MVLKKMEWPRLRLEMEIGSDPDDKKAGVKCSDPPHPNKFNPLPSPKTCSIDRPTRPRETRPLPTVRLTVVALELMPLSTTRLPFVPMVRILG